MLVFLITSNTASRAKTEVEKSATTTLSRDSKHTVKHASKSSTSKKRVKRGGDQNSEEELRLLIREYVSLKNRSTGDKCVVAEEFQGVCSKIKVGNKIGKFPLCCSLEQQRDSIILNKRQRMAQRKKVITEIQDDLQIMITGRKKRRIVLGVRLRHTGPITTKETFFTTTKLPNKQFHPQNFIAGTIGTYPESKV